MKFSWKSYWQPTPQNVRKVADAILAGATLASTYSYVVDREALAGIIMIVAVVAKIISNFLTDDNSQTP